MKIEEPVVHILVDIPGVSAESGIFTLAQNCHSWSVGSFTGKLPVEFIAALNSEKLILICQNNFTKN